MLLEAGGDPRGLSGGDRAAPGENRLPDDYDVPAFHPFASENEAMRWDFFVRHYANDELQRRDPNHREEWGGRPVDGVLYPRAGTLGGCTAHNAMILVCPHDADWDAIASLTGDPSWSAERCAYFVRLENCRTGRSSAGSAGGWGSTAPATAGTAGCTPRKRSRRTPGRPAARGRDLGVGPLRVPRERGLAGAVVLAPARRPRPQRRRPRPRERRGRPLHALDHARPPPDGSRERVLETARRFPDRLRVELDALATRVLFDGHGRAAGVEYLKGERLYRARPPEQAPGERREVRASREVILAGGAFNTPQLLMLSGLGPQAELERLGIPVRVDLPGVGRNLQDRYEVASSTG